jgi:hypothetical protein
MPKQHKMVDSSGYNFDMDFRDILQWIREFSYTSYNTIMANQPVYLKMPMPFL